MADCLRHHRREWVASVYSGKLSQCNDSPHKPSGQLENYNTEETNQCIEAVHPSPPGDEEMRSWLQQDWDNLTQKAVEQTGLDERLVKLRDAPNPLRIVGPAELQNPEAIPDPYRNRTYDLFRHLRARRLALLPGGAIIDFYGVYYVQFILVASDMLGAYGCFFDFVTGAVLNDQTTEQYYKDVVSLSTRHEYRRIMIGESEVLVPNAPTFGMSLSSGEKIEVTFASRDYFLKLPELAEFTTTFDPERWVSNPEPIADNAIKALRSHLRMHKQHPPSEEA